MTNTLQWPLIAETLNWQQVSLLNPTELQNQKYLNLRLQALWFNSNKKSVLEPRTQQTK